MGGGMTVRRSISADDVALPPTGSGWNRFAGAGRLTCAAVLAALAALIVLGLVSPALVTGGNAPKGKGDIILYRKIIADVRGGEDYYPAAVREQRAGHYPVRPFVAVRPPTLTWAMAALPNDAARLLAVRLLGWAAFLAWLVRLRAWRQPVWLGAATVVVGSGVIGFVADYVFALHEVWAGLLISLALAIWGRKTWWISLVLGLAAASLRDLAAAYLLAMAALAWKDARRWEGAAWTLAIGVFAACMALHAAALQPWVGPGDRVSHGWLSFSGWPFLLAALKWNLILIIAPHWLEAVFVPLALLGLCARRDPLGERLALTVIGYGAAFLIVGRPDNNYWGALIAPLWPLGLLTAGPALSALARRVTGAQAGASSAAEASDA